ncbi:transglycosylase SLT domain-containing protein [Inhella sp.]|uniref:transglycosylase SLT domain-containing protein n=1 Tax=Inhella sp. TaxID=1921806 RepID=UPI0035AF0D7E
MKTTHTLSLIATVLCLAGCAQLPTDAPGAPSPVTHPQTGASWGQVLGAGAPASAVPAETVKIVSLPVVEEPAEAPKPIVRDDLQTDALPVDFQSAQAHADLWARIRAGLQLGDLSGPRVDKWEAYYGKRPDYVARMTERGGRYLFHIVEEVQRRQLPMELALLPFIESAFNPEAKSRVAASGMWQFMSATGKDFDLKQNLFRDDRRDVLASTRAALDYLEQLGRRYDGDWQLALAAYNWGMGNVDRAVKRAKAAGKEGRYEDLRMPTETADYVPKLQAIENLVREPERFGVILPLLANHPFFLSVRVDRDIDVELAAELAGLTPEVFRQFNPQMNKPVILAAATPQLLLPYDNAERFARNFAQHRGSFASWTAWQTPKTMKPADAAKQIGMSETELRAVNGIKGRMLIKGGSTLLVPRTAKRDHDVSEHLADSAQLALAPEQRQVRRTVKARKGDTLATIAKRHGLPVARVVEWNGGRAVHAKLKTGEAVTLMSPARAVAKAPPNAKTQAKAGKKTAARKPGTPRVAQGKPPVRRPAKPS